MAGRSSVGVFASGVEGPEGVLRPMARFTRRFCEVTDEGACCGGVDVDCAGATFQAAVKELFKDGSADIFAALCVLSFNASSPVWKMLEM